jgi:hypothetical protein
MDTGVGGGVKFLLFAGAAFFLLVGAILIAYVRVFARGRSKVRVRSIEDISDGNLRELFSRLMDAEKIAIGMLAVRADRGARGDVE